MEMSKPGQISIGNLPFLMVSTGNGNILINLGHEKYVDINNENMPLFE